MWILMEAFAHLTDEAKNDACKNIQSLGYEGKDVYANHFAR